MQDGKERVIMYRSKGFEGSQQKWCTTRRELWAIVYFVTTQFSFYLQGRNFTLHTHHSSLWWFISFHDKASDVLAILSRTFDAIYENQAPSSITHGNANALSRFETRLCPREDCPDPGHKLPKFKLSKLEDEANLNPVLTHNQMNSK